MIIEKGSLENIDEILSINDRSGFNDGWNREMLLSSFGGNFFVLIARINGLAVGYVAVTKSVDTADIEMVAVDSNFKRRGVAKELILTAETALKNDDIKDFFLEVRKSNTLAVMLYKKLGYNLINERKKYYPDGEDALVLSKKEQL